MHNGCTHGVASAQLSSVQAESRVVFGYVYYHGNCNTGDELKTEYRVEQGKNHSYM